MQVSLTECKEEGFSKLWLFLGLAGLGMTGCRRPEHAILPRQEPGGTHSWNSRLLFKRCPTSGGFIPLIVESLKIVPPKLKEIRVLSKAWKHRHIQPSQCLDLYDPDRARGASVKESSSSDNESSTRWKKSNRHKLKRRLRTSISLEMLPSWLTPVFPVYEISNSNN